MTEQEKWEQRLQAAEHALKTVRDAAILDRKMSHDQHTNGHYTLAITQIESVASGCRARLHRLASVGR